MEANFNEERLYNDIVELIERTKSTIQRSVNSELVMLYWNIGKQINENILDKDKIKYGSKTLKSISEKLFEKYGRGFSMQNVYRMILIHEFFNNFEIFSTLSRKLSWSHLVEILGQKSEVKREFYVTMCINENWSVRTLREN